MEVMIIEAAAAHADRVGNKDENKSDFTCEDYENELETTDWWDEDFDDNEDIWEEEFVEKKKSEDKKEKTEDELEMEAKWEEIKLFEQFK
eukprot:5229101-Heterocapsa_arctica.AAC.1